VRSHRANFSCACDCPAAIVARVGSKRSTRSIVGVRSKSNFEFSPSFVISDSLCQALAAALLTCHPSALRLVEPENDLSARFKGVVGVNHEKTAEGQRHGFFNPVSLGTEAGILRSFRIRW
jgi:hypothetical protein